MKYISTDVESTGLNKGKAVILQISMIFVNTLDKNPKEDAKKLTFFIGRDLDNVYWEDTAKKMNTWIIESIKGIRKPKYPIVPLNKVLEVIEAALIEAGYVKHDDGKYHVNFAGANFEDYDKVLLYRDLVGLVDLIHAERRSLDPSLCFVDYDKTPVSPVSFFQKPSLLPRLLSTQ